MNNKDIDLNAMFLGPKSENLDVFLKNLIELFNDHAQWRKNFHKEDIDAINLNELNTQNYKDSNIRMEEVLKDLSSKLSSGLMPWHSPRYMGHMNSETLMPALLGYFAAMLYNGNNVSYEGAPATSIMEQEVGEDLCVLMGINPKVGWAHICCDGSIANYESLWYARNLKSFPLALKQVVPELVEGKSQWELLNMSIDEILNLIDKVLYKIDELKAHSARAISNEIPKLGKLIVPQTKHYSWLKAADILGIGLNNVVTIAVDENYRMDIDILKSTIDELIDKKIPILGVVAIVGTTEEGAIDHIDKIVKLKDDYSKKGINFYLHIDAAYGGYARAIFLDEDNKFIEKDKLSIKYKEHEIFKNLNIDFPSTDVYNAFKDMYRADSITIDSHKMGYVPYGAGGLVIRDKRMRRAVAYFANYVFKEDDEAPVLLGSYIMEGSRPGASAASVWTAHRTMPLNITGYGRLIGSSIEGARNLYGYIKEKKQYNIGKKVVNIYSLIKPDFNMIDLAFNIEGNKDLEKMNELNNEFYKEASFYTSLYTNNFLTSHTIFDKCDYGNSPITFIKSCGIPEEEWERVKSLTLLRCAILCPFLNKGEIFEEYINKINEAIIEKLKKILC